MSDMEHDNKQNEDLPGSGEDKGKEFIKLKVVGQDNSEVHFNIKVTEKISERRTLIGFQKLCQE